MCTRRPLRRLACALLCAWVASILPAAAAEEDLGTYRGWRAIRFTEGGQPVCMMWSEPAKEEGKYTRRGDVFVFVTHRPAEGIRDAVSFEAGYPFREAGELSVKVGDGRFKLRTGGTTAWSASTADDGRLVKAMRAGRSMVVEGVSRRGTLTRDTYSLLGFTAAHRAIAKACKKG